MRPKELLEKPRLVMVQLLDILWFLGEHKVNLPICGNCSRYQKNPTILIRDREVKDCDRDRKVQGVQFLETLRSMVNDKRPTGPATLLVLYRYFVFPEYATHSGCDPCVIRDRKVHGTQ
jgi:hypothetical protein